MKQYLSLGQSGFILFKSTNTDISNFTIKSLRSRGQVDSDF